MPLSNGDVIRLVDAYLHGLLDDDQAAEVAQRCQTSPECKSALEEAQRRLSALQSQPPVEASEQLIRATVEQINRTVQVRRTRSRRVLIGMAGALAASVLILSSLHVYYSNLTPSPIDLAVLGQRDLLAATMSSLRIRLTNAPTRQPLAGVPVTVELKDRATDKTVRLARLDTDEEGGAQPRFELPDWKEGKYTLTITAKTPKGTEVVSQPVTLKRSWQVMLSSDKPVYQPGQVIHLRSLALRRPDLKPVGEQVVVFAISDPKGNVIFKQKGSTSPYGISSADCELAGEVIEGAYTIACQVGDTESRLQVQVLKYVLPRFRVAVKLDRPFYKPGDTIQCVVQADYFFGKPVANAQVEIDVRPANGRHHVVLRARTNDQGTAALTHKLPDNLLGPLEPQQARPESSETQLTVTATVTDSADQKQTAAGSRIVTREPVRIHVFPEGGTLVEGVDNRIYLLVTQADGAPVRAVLTISGIRDEIKTDERGAAVFEYRPKSREVRWTIRAVNEAGDFLARKQLTRECGDAAEDFLVRTDKAVYRGGESVQLTALGAGSEPVFVDFIQDGKERVTLLSATIPMSNGQGELTLDLPADVSGTLELCAYRIADSGKAMRKSRVVYIQPASDLKITANLDQAEYRPGGLAKLNLKLTDNRNRPVPGAVSLVGVDEAVFAVLPQSPGREKTYFTLEQKLLEPIQAIYPWSPDRRPQPADEASNRFEMALFAATVRNLIGPRFSPLVKRPLGRPSMMPKIDPGAQQQGGLFASTAYSLEVQSYPQKVQETNLRRSRGETSLRYGWLGLLGFILLSAYISLWFFLKSSRLIEIHVIIGLGILVICSGITTLGVRENTPFNAVASRVGTAAKGEKQPGMKMLPATSPMPPGAQGEAQDDPSAPRVREEFPETLLWKPLLITNDNGELPTQDIPLADSITTWRLSASAVSKDGQLGAAQLGLKVFQSFFVDLDLPVYLTRNDEVMVRAVVYNYDTMPQTVTLKLTDADWFVRQGDAELKLEVKPGEPRLAGFRIKVTRAGSHELLVSAQASGGRQPPVADAIKKIVEVVPDGRPVEELTSGTLQDDADVRLSVPKEAIEGGTRATLKIYPSSFSQVVEGLDNIFRLPYGCFEQTSSTTYPNVLALDYLKRTGQSRPEVEFKARRYIHLGYQRLLTFEIAGGGFEWFGRGPANVRLSAYGLMEFSDMAKVHDIDPNLLAQTRKFLLDKRQPNGSWEPDRLIHVGERPGRPGGDADPVKEDDARLASTAYVAWAVFSSGTSSAEARPTLDFLRMYRPEHVRNPYLLALVCNALLAIDPSGQEAAPYLERLEFRKSTSEDGKLTWWSLNPEERTAFYGAGVGGDVEATALASLALMQGRKNPGTIKAALAWLVQKKGPGGLWYSTQATVLALKALLAGTSAGANDADRRFVVKMGQWEREIRVPPDQADVVQQIDLKPHLKEGGNRLTVRELSETAAGFQVTLRYYLPDAGAPRPAAEPFALSLDFDRTAVAVGDMVQATVRVSNKMKQEAAMVMLELPVPAGFVPAAEDFADLLGKGTIARYQASNRQVLLYLRDLASGLPLEFTYRLRARTPGKITAQGARVYEYYAPERQAATSGVAMRIEDR